MASKKSDIHRVAVVKKAKYSDDVEKRLYGEGSSYLNQFYTPPDVAEFMARIAFIKPRHHVLDMAMGSGALLFWVKPYSKNIYGIEINYETYKKAQETLGSGTFIHGDALSQEEKVMSLPYNSFDKIIINPPFGPLIGERSLKPFTLKPRRQEILFIEEAEKYLKMLGVIVAIVPDGLLSGETYKPVREWILRHFRLVAVISLPQKLFFNSQRKTRANEGRTRPSTTTKTSIVVLQKQPEKILKALYEKREAGILFARIDEEKERQAQFDAIWKEYWTVFI